MSDIQNEKLYNLVLSSLKLLALKSEPITTPQYLAAMFQAVKNMNFDDNSALEQVSNMPRAMLKAMEEDEAVKSYLNAQKGEIEILANELTSIDAVKKLISSVSLESLNVEYIREKARAFINKFDDSDVIDRLTIIIQFIEENRVYVEDFLGKIGPNSQEYRDISDNVFIIAVNKANELKDQCINDAAKRAKIFEAKADIGYGSSMWEEYSYLLINNSRWPLTEDAKYLWAMWVLEFGQLKFAVDKDKSGGCFIATACYGSYDDSNVMTLRDYRDNHLSKTNFGRIFIKTYYFLSPPLARFIAKSDKLRHITKRILVQPIVHIIRKRFS